VTRRWVKSAAFVLVLATIVGCGREADKDKNKDLDRPRSAEKAK
jgi:hypothetical protein